MTTTNSKLNETELRDSEEWSEIRGVTVLDPDGWDRRNFDESWSEKITLEEFSKRLAFSTQMKRK